MVFDIVIRNGLVMDGTGNPHFRADVGIEKGRVGRIKRSLGGEAERIIDASGLIICPGFIDMHSHSDLTLLINPKAESKVRQGVTTELNGNCGDSPAPIKQGFLEDIKRSFWEWGQLVNEVRWDWLSFGDFLSRLEKQGVALNVALLVGHRTIRINVMGYKRRSPTPDEMEEMKTLINQAMKDGAFGLSSGLYYPPGSFAGTDELIELCKVVAKHGGIYETHVRGESSMLLDSVMEAIEIGERARVPVQVAHLKAYGSPYWPLVKEVLRAIDEAKERGVDVTVNRYGYLFGLTGLGAMLPQWAHEGGREKLKERLNDPKIRKRVKRDMAKGLPSWESHIKATGWETVILASCPECKEYEGRSIAEASKMKGMDPYELAFDLLLKDQKGKGGITILIYGMNEDNLHMILRHPFSMIGSDGWALAPYGILSKGRTHPRMYGCYPRILAKYVREKRILTLEEAIRKMSSFPAQILGLQDRGLLKERMWADVVIFNPKTVADKATVENPNIYPQGIEYVLVNGEIVIEEGEHTGALPGKVLRLSQYTEN